MDVSHFHEVKVSCLKTRDLALDLVHLLHTHVLWEHLARLVEPQHDGLCRLLNDKAVTDKGILRFEKCLGSQAVAVVEVEPLGKALGLCQPSDTALQAGFENIHKL